MKGEPAALAFPHVEVWRQPDGFWRWRFRDPADGTLLLSNESHPTRDGAAHAAGLAYPGVPMVEPRRPPMARVVARSAATGAVGGLVAALLATLTLFITKLIRVAIRARRIIAKSSRRSRT